MEEDERCCGTGTCIINDEGLCWCGQQWSGSTMCRPGSTGLAPSAHAATNEQTDSEADLS